jgi:hypothetical protein
MFAESLIGRRKTNFASTGRRRAGRRAAFEALEGRLLLSLDPSWVAQSGVTAYASSPYYADVAVDNAGDVFVGARIVDGVDGQKEDI